MNAAVLCPGPSLSQCSAIGLSQYDVRVGVNRAILFRECDWWTFLDYSIFENEAIKPIGKPRILTSEGCIDTLALHGFSDKLKKYEVTRLDAVAKHFPVFGWTLYSASCSLALAAHLGATQIDVYGADWKIDAPDYDGVQLHSNQRGEQRWKSEAVLWDQFVSRLHDRGVSVKRILP